MAGISGFDPRIGWNPSVQTNEPQPAPPVAETQPASFDIQAHQGHIQSVLAGLDQLKSGWSSLLG